MHIGLVSPMWPAVDLYPNGIVTYVHNVRIALTAQGHRVSVFTGSLGQTSADPGIFRVEQSVNFRTRARLNELLRRRFRNYPLWGRALAAKVNAVHHDDPIDVLEMEETFGWCAEVQKHVPFPVVVKLHGPGFLDLTDEDRESELGRARIGLEGDALRQMAAIASPSRRTLEDTVSRYDLAPRIRKVIRNPMAVEADLESWTIEGCDKKTIFFVGRFDKRKGGDTALLAFRKLLEIDRHLKLIFVGPDVGLTSASGARVFFHAFRDSLFTETQRARVEFLGHLPRDKIPGMRSKALLTLVTSRWENQPNTALEAMIQGCPIVACDSGGMSELVEHGVTGLLARGGDIDDLCRQIASLLNDPGRARDLGQNARRFVMERHSAPKLAEEAVDFYRQAVLLAKPR